MNIEIRKGEIFGLLGPNGAGKSTTMNMICSIVRPTAGEIELFVGNPWKKKKGVIDKIGYIPQELAIHGNLKAWENVEFLSLFCQSHLFSFSMGKTKEQLSHRTALAVFYLTGKKPE